MTQHDDPIIELLKSAFKQAPQALHHVFALDGANDAFASLQTAEIKAAYLLQMIAIELHKASKEIDSTNVLAGPNDIKFHIVRTDRFFATVPFDITTLDLGHFEDLYYATCAKLKELLHGVDVHLTNGFKSPFDTYFIYRCSRLKVLDPIQVGDFRASLLVYESILYSSELTELLKKGIMSIHYKDPCGKEMSSCGQSTMAEMLINSERSEIYDNVEKNPEISHEQSQQNRKWLTGIGGLHDVRDLSCSMIYASLAEKYRSTVLNTNLLGPSIDRQATPDVPQTCQELGSGKAYVSPYNLDERAKKLHAPGGPEMPCICDPECICTPVCASDPTQNCLCEENGLFTRVTQGMDIDDLDVPDLVRRGGGGCVMKERNSVSRQGSIQESLELPFDGSCYTSSNDATGDVYFTRDMVKDGLSFQQTQSPNGTWSIDTNWMRETLESPDSGMVESGDIHIPTPPRVSSLLYRDALRQPFAKQCDYPPKRSSVTQRLFSSRNITTTISKKVSNRAAKKLQKQVNKRSRPDHSFIGLRLALHRTPQVHKMSEDWKT